jgi:hypothetical protein
MRSRLDPAVEGEFTVRGYPGIRVQQGNCEMAEHMFPWFLDSLQLTVPPLPCQTTGMTPNLIRRDLDTTGGKCIRLALFLIYKSQMPSKDMMLLRFANKFQMGTIGPIFYFNWFYLIINTINAI